MWGRDLPGLVGAVIRPLVHRHFELHGYPLAGALTGCRMVGKVPGAYRDGSYEPEVSQTVMLIVQPGWICVDVGAHLGYFTMLLAKLVGEHGRVIAFEAHPDNAAQTRSNVGMNGYEARVRVENMAVSDGAHHSVKLYPGRDHSSFEWNIVGHDVQGNPVQHELDIPATSLDAYFPPGLRVDFVKMDVEGAEAQALCGMRRLLRQSRPFVVVEFHSEAGWAGRRELFAMDYCLYDIRDGRWLASKLDFERVYHCLAAPRERIADIGL